MSTMVRISVIGACMHQRSGQDALDAAIAHLDAKLAAVLPDQPDLIVLPEFCDMAASDSLEAYREFASRHGEQILEYLAGVARRHCTWITYPALRRTTRNQLRNSIQLINREGGVAGVYDKNHLTITEMEAGIQPGDDATIVQTDFGRVAMAICFDLNFEELRTRVAKQSPDLILFCSMYHGGLMQEYWAYSCRAHFASAVTSLPSRIVSPVGQTLATTTNYMDWATASINLDCRLVHLDYHAEKLRDLKKKYGPDVRVLDPGLLAPVLVTSDTDAASADQMLKEFEIEPLDHYLNRCRQHLDKHRTRLSAPSDA